MRASTASQRGYAAALAAVIIWALIPVGTRYFVLRVDPYVFNAIRFAASGCAALPLCLYAKPWLWKRQDRSLLAVCAVLAVPGYNIPVALGARTVSAGALGLLIATESVMIVALTLVMQRRPIHGRITAGSLIALIGVALTSGVLTSAQGFKWLGTLQVLGGALSWSCYTVLAAPLNRRYGTFGVTGTILVLGTVVLLGLSLPMIDPGALPGRGTTLMLAVMGLASSLFGFLLWNYAGAEVPSERLGLFVYMIPVVSVYAGMRFLRESLTLQMLAGGVLVVIGVWIASRAGRLAHATVIE